MTNTRSSTHAIMFHHFHSDLHPIGQGSISAEQFETMIEWLSDRYNLLGAREYLYKLKSKALDANDVCLTFDDGLLCQFDVAAPILKKKKLEAFFFIYSAPLTGEADSLEVYRYFRTTKFETIDDFYEKFFHKTKELFGNEYAFAQQNYKANEYLKVFKYYTETDKWFRFLRDITLGKERYQEVMNSMMVERDFDPTQAMGKLWMSDEILRTLKTDGHEIGLHSYSHPTTIHMLDKSLQEKEYERNYNHLSELLNFNPISMSHPCGHYNNDTLSILSSKNIEIGFRSNYGVKEIMSNLEVPREDHANILKEMG